MVLIIFRNLMTSRHTAPPAHHGQVVDIMEAL
jgi:hypothetical protein